MTGGRGRRLLRRGALLALVAAVVSIACGRPGPPSGFQACTVDFQKASVLELMRTYYLWNDEPMQAAKYIGIDLGDYATVDDLLDYLRWMENPADPADARDRGFTFVDTVANDDAFTSGGEFSMYGFLFDAPGDGTMTVQLIIPDSPAERAGMRRGDQVITIGGRTIETIEDNEGIAEALGNFAPGTTRRFFIEADRFPMGSTIDLTTEFVALPPLAPNSANPTTDWVFNIDGNRIGYLPFFVFVQTAIAELDRVFNHFRLAGVDHLVVDLRYNGGGVLGLAQYLGSHMVNRSRVGSTMFSIEYNNARSGLDTDVRYLGRSEGINNPLENLQTIVFITGPATASASELVINSLLAEIPTIDVAVVGTPSFGKPVGQEGFDFCSGQLRLRPVSFELRNANGFGDYYEGLEVDCPAVDDLGHELGDVDEASFDTAIAYITDGVCPGGSGTGAAPSARSTDRPVHRPPWLRPRALD